MSCCGTQTKNDNVDVKGTDSENVHILGQQKRYTNRFDSHFFTFE
jgi:hypothetical protein